MIDRITIQDEKNIPLPTPQGLLQLYLSDLDLLYPGTKLPPRGTILP
ncbi:MAG: hypothetical protein IH600_15855 [Bacteroidetes bacterium]|nr:hypothetical protein [Bacteroidota bacterium]